MNKQVQRIIDGYTDQHTAYTQHNSTNSRRNDSQHRHTHEPAERNRKENKP